MNTSCIDLPDLQLVSARLYPERNPAVQGVFQRMQLNTALTLLLTHLLTSVVTHVFILDQDISWSFIFSETTY